MPPKSPKTAPPTAYDPLFAQLFEIRPRKGDRTKFRIVVAAIDSIAEHGIHGTTFESVGNRVGLARRNVAYHFPEMEGLIVAAVKFAVATGQRTAVEMIVKGDSWQGQLELYIASTFEWMARNPKHGSVLLSLYALAAQDDRFHELYCEIRAAGQNRVRTILGTVRWPSVKAHAETSQTVYNLLNGNLVMFLTSDPGPPARPWSRLTLESALVLIRAHAKP